MRTKHVAVQRTAALLAAVLALVLTGATANASAGGTGPKPDPHAATNRVSASGGFRIGLDPKTHTLKVDQISGKVSATDATGKAITAPVQPRHLSVTPVTGSTKAPTDTLGSYQCIIDTSDNSNLVGYTPDQLNIGGNSYYVSWNFNPYTVDYARYISNYWTLQTEMCFTGGGDTWNAWSQWYDSGQTTTTGDTYEPVRIGQTWGTHTDSNGTLSTTLNFQVSAGPVQIGGSTTVSPQDTYAGQLGYDPNNNWQSPDDNNLVDAYYIAPDNYIWDGTSNFEGNNGQVLWEQPEGSYVYWYDNTTINALCSLVGQEFGNNCASFN